MPPEFHFSRKCIVLFLFEFWFLVVAVDYFGMHLHSPSNFLMSIVRKYLDVKAVRPLVLLSIGLAVGLLFLQCIGFSHVYVPEAKANKTNLSKFVSKFSMFPISLLN